MRPMAHELRRHARKIAHPAGDVPAVMLAAADEIERLQSLIAGLREACQKVIEEYTRTQPNLSYNAREALSEASARIYKRDDA